MAYLDFFERTLFEYGLPFEVYVDNATFSEVPPPRPSPSLANVFGSTESPFDTPLHPKAKGKLNASTKSGKSVFPPS